MPDKNSVLFVQGAGQGAYDEDVPLVASLQRALGSAYDVHYPRMPNEDDAEYADWRPRITSELAGLGDQVSLVGHSVGASVLLKYVCEERPKRSIAGLYLIATPFWNGGGIWKWDEGRLPDDASARLAYIPRIIFYHSRDDETVPFAHLALNAERLPHATIREFDGRGHMFGGDFPELSDDITRDERPRG